MRVHVVFVTHKSTYTVLFLVEDKTHTHTHKNVISVLVLNVQEGIMHGRHLGAEL